MELTTEKALAKALGISPKTLGRYRSREGSPAGNDLDEWRRFLAAHQSGQGRRTEVASMAALRAALIAAQTRERNATAKLREWEIEVKAANLVPMAEAHSVLKKALQAVSRQLETMPRAVSSRANPADPELAERAIREAVEHLKKAVVESLHE